MVPVKQRMTGFVGDLERFCNWSPERLVFSLMVLLMMGPPFYLFLQKVSDGVSVEAVL